MATFDTARDVLLREGFVVIESFFRPDEVHRAHEEVLALRAAIERAPNPQVPLYRGWGSTEILSNLYGTCPTLDKMFEQLLIDPRSRALLEMIGGKHFKNRDYTVRIMTGAPDHGSHYNPPLEWHRDSKGEFVVGIYLTDCPAGDNSATSFIPGSYVFPYDPRWNALLGHPFYLGNSRLQRKFGQWFGLSLFLKLNFFGRKLGAQVTKAATGAFGKVGDFYIFINETWHGRLANLHGRKIAIVQIGFFPSEFPFPNPRQTIPAESMAKLPQAIGAALIENKPANRTKGALVYHILRKQIPRNAPAIFMLARIERKVAEFISFPVVLPLILARRLAGGVLRTIRRRL